MASITIRNLDDSLKSRLRIRAAQHGRSMEEEARTILRDAIGSAPTDSGLANLAKFYFGPADGVELELPERDVVREPPVLDE